MDIAKAITKMTQLRYGEGGLWSEEWMTSHRNLGESRSVVQTEVVIKSRVCCQDT